MSFKVIFLVYLTALVSSCGSSDNSVKDDWPGIDEITLIDGAGTQSLAVNNQFSLNSSVSLPRMGKDVSFTLKTECQRTLPSGSTKKEAYIKSIDYKASENQEVKSLDLIDHLPEEVLIFPEFFKTCDIELMAKNQNGSTDKSLLSGYEFVLDEDSLQIDIVSKSGLKRAVKKDEMSLVNVSPKNASTLTNSELICYTNKISKSTINKNSEKELSGTLFKLPKPTKDIPVENCVVIAKNHENKTIVSSRIQILNSTSYKKFTAGVSSYVVGKDSKKQVPYRGSLGKKHSLLRFVISNQSEGIQVVKFPEGPKNHADIHIVSHLTQKLNPYKKSTNLYTHFVHNIHYKKMPALFSWKNQSLKTSKMIKLNPGAYATIELTVETNFLCSAVGYSSSNNHEIGFIASLPESSPVFNLEHVSVNEFTEDAIATGNIFDAFELPYTLPSNLPVGSHFSKKTNAIEIFFRNKNVKYGEPLSLYYTRENAIYGQNGEPINIQIGRGTMKAYTFHDYLNPKTISCISKDALSD